MELEQLKTSWVELDNRLKKNESLTESLIVKMTQNRARRSISKLLYWEIFGAIFAVLAFVLISYIYNKSQSQFLFRDITLIFGIGIGLISIIWQVYKICKLTGIDFSKKINGNIYNINRYNILIKGEKSASVAVLFIFILIIGASYIEMNVGLYGWMFLLGITICALPMLYFSYKIIYNRNIASILDSMNEIKDIEDRD